MVNSALELAEITTEDRFAGLARCRRSWAQLTGDLELYSDRHRPACTPDGKSSCAKRAEAAALASDPRITNSEGAIVRHHTRDDAYSRTRAGFVGSIARSYCSIERRAGGERERRSMERDYWFTHRARIVRSGDRRRRWAATPPSGPCAGWVRAKVATQKVPVIFEPRTARSLLDNIFDAVNGDSMYRHESFLAGKLGEKIASDKLTVIDDGTIPGLFGTSPFDDEGVPTRRTVVIEKGVLKSYLLNTYTARKLGMKTTGNASRGITGNAGGRPRQLLRRERRDVAGGNHREHPERLLCHRIDGLRCQHRNRRLLSRRRRTVDRERRIDVSRVGSDHRRHAA